MSYSFSIRAANKAAAKAEVSKLLAQTVEVQKEHSHDRAQAEAAAHAFIDALVDDAAYEVAVSMHGSVGWRNLEDGSKEFTSASVGVSAYLVPPLA